MLVVITFDADVLSLQNRQPFLEDSKMSFSTFTSNSNENAPISDQRAANASCASKTPCQAGVGLGAGQTALTLDDQNDPNAMTYEWASVPETRPTPSNNRGKWSTAIRSLTDVCGVYSPEIGPPKEKPVVKKAKYIIEPYRCPRCNSPFTRPYTIKQHFPACVRKYGNPCSVKWTDYARVRGRDQKSRRYLMNLNREVIYS